MGLLSDPEYGSVKWVKILKKIHGPLCFLCYISAIVWFIMLGNKEFNNETYFSENALLPGLVTNEFNGEIFAKQFHNELLRELEDKYENIEDIPIPWLVGKMSQLHLDVYTHNYTLNYPLGHGQVYKGTNVYGILRAPRTSSLEALVVSAPYRSLSSHLKGTTAGIALMLAFAQFARSQKYWAKDIIFLVTEHEQLGMQAWLEAYHGIQSDAETFYTSLGSFWKPGDPALDFAKLTDRFSWAGHHKKCLNPGRLQGRSGSIQAAINLELHTPKIKYIEVKVEGLNGQLPNLDLVNLVHKLCVKSGIHHSYKNSYSWIKNRNMADQWTTGVYTMLGMVTAQIAGVPNGNHGLFHRFGIEAVTLEGRAAEGAGVGAAGAEGAAPPRAHALSNCNFYRLGVALESVLRSLNNLLERFHQSYFFYLLAATNRFVSIGQYMPCLCLLCVAMLVRALSLWVNIQQDDVTDTQTKTKTKSAISEEPKSDESKASEESSGKVPGGEEIDGGLKKKKETVSKKKRRREEDSMSIVSVGANYLLVHLIGYAVMNSPMILSQIGAAYDQPTEVSVYYGLVAISGTLAALVALASLWGRLGRRELSLLNILALVELATACLAVGMHNFPLGLAIGVLYTPLALVASVVEHHSTMSRVRLHLKRALCVSLHPLSALTLCTLAYGRALVPEEGWLASAGRGRDAAMQAVMFAVVDSMIYGNWLFNVATSVLFPTWLIFWQLLCHRVDK